MEQVLVKLKITKVPHNHLKILEAKKTKQNTHKKQQQKQQQQQKKHKKTHTQNKNNNKWHPYFASLW